MTTEEMAALGEQVAEILAKRTGAPGAAPGATMAAGFGGMMPAGQAAMMPSAMMGVGAGTPQPTGLLLRAKMQMPDGSAAPCYLSFGPEALAGGPQGVAQLVGQLMQAGWPIDLYPPRNNYGGGGGGNWNNGGGGNAAYGRRSYGRRW
ncbi:MAG: hypothetical protein JW809_16525 [Pirellulales bacterium]|nr:hypothetical protein [Pirellulales bacterium]